MMTFFCQLANFFKLYPLTSKPPTQKLKKKNTSLSTLVSYLSTILNHYFNISSTQNNGFFLPFKGTIKRGDTQTVLFSTELTWMNHTLPTYDMTSEFKPFTEFEMSFLLKLYNFGLVKGFIKYPGRLQESHCHSQY